MGVQYKDRKVGVLPRTEQRSRNLQRAGAGLMVKGTTFKIQSETSVQKTLRKPRTNPVIGQEMPKQSLQKRLMKSKQQPQNLQEE